MKRTSCIFLSLLLTALLLGSCGTYKNYSRPDDVKSYGICADTTGGDTTRVAWEDYFLEPCLQQLIRTGLAHNADLRVAHLQCEEAAASLRAARWAYAPSLSFSPQGTASGTLNAAATYSYDLPLSASWQVDLFGSLRNASRRAQAQLERSASYAQAVQTQLVGNIAAYYYKLVLLDRQLAVYRETSANWQKNVETTRRLMTAGQYTAAAVAQSEANYYSICAATVEIAQQRLETENALRSLVGDSLGTIARDTAARGGISDAFAQGVPLSLLALRPDVRQAEQNLAAYFYAEGEARAAFYPSLTLSGTLGWSNSSGGIVLNPAQWIGSAVGSLTQPLLQRGKLRSQLKIAQAQQEEAKVSFQQTLLKAGIEVNDALSQIQSYRQSSNYYARQVQALRQAVASTSALMQHGSSTYLEVLTAQQSLLSAQLTLLGNDYNEKVAKISLFQAL